MKSTLNENKKSLLLVLGVLALLAYFALHVKTAPYPEQIVIVRTSGAACAGAFSTVLKKETGVLGIASVAGSGEFHVGISREASPDTVRKTLESVALPATVVGVLSPVQYRTQYGHYFRTGTFTTCNGGCRK